MKYRMKLGRWARVENGVTRRYKVGDAVELNEREAAAIAMLIEPFVATPPEAVAKLETATLEPSRPATLVPGFAASTLPPKG